MDTSQPQPFCLIPTGLPPLMTPSSIPSPTSFIYTLPTTRPYNHLVVFLLPGITLPPNTAAAVYLSLPQSSNPGDFKFLGGIGEGKESAIFKISGLLGDHGGQGGMPELTIGISLEDASEIGAKMSAISSANTNNNSSGPLVLANKTGAAAASNSDQTVKLAQRIIKNAFNFLASFSGNMGGGVEVVPLKAFEEWWRKFEGRVVRDPGFLEREED